MNWVKRLAGIALIVVVALGVPIGVGVLAATSAARSIYPAATAAMPAMLPTPAYDPTKPTVVVVVGSAGANVADTLAPYETLASTGAVNVYTVAPQRKPVTLTGGLAHIPELDFAGLQRLVPDGPDAIIVPALPGAGEPQTADVTQWLLAQRARHHPIIASVCVGAEVLASAGLLDGRPATAHWLGLIGLRRNYPGVQWRVGQRYVDDGDVLTGATVLSGVDVALRLLERLTDRATARRAADAVDWPFYSPDRSATFEPPKLSFADTPALLNASFRWDRPRIGVLLSDGVGETELAAAFRPYTELSYLATPVSMTLGDRVIRSRHGLVFVADADVESDVNLTRIIVPGADAANRAIASDVRRPVTYLHDRPGFAFDGALRDIAATYDVATARWVAKSLQYPATHLDLAGPAWPWMPTVRPILMVATIGLSVLLIVAMVRRRRGAK